MNDLSSDPLSWPKPLPREAPQELAEDAQEHLRDSVISRGVLVIGVVGLCVGLGCWQLWPGIFGLVYFGPALVRTLQRLAAEPVERQSSRLCLTAFNDSLGVMAGILGYAGIAFWAIHSITSGLGAALVERIGASPLTDVLLAILGIPSLAAGLVIGACVARTTWFEGFPVEDEPAAPLTSSPAA